jgi:hypothetical protein
MPPPSAVPGIHQEAQRRLARVRTDLDAFSDVEIDSLMLDGYLIATAQLEPPRLAGLLPPSADPLEENWIFRRVEALLGRPPPAYLRKLSAASGRFFKSIHPRSTPGWVFAALLLVGAATVLWLYRDALLDVFGTIRFWRALGVGALVALGPLVAGRLFALMLGPRLLARPGTSLAFVARWMPIVAVVAASVALVTVTFARGESIGDRLDLAWPSWALALTAGLAFYGLALTPLALSVAFWLDGKLYLHQGKLPQIDEVVEE